MSITHCLIGISDHSGDVWTCGTEISSGCVGATATVKSWNILGRFAIWVSPNVAISNSVRLPTMHGRPPGYGIDRPLPVVEPTLSAPLAKDWLPQGISVIWRKAFRTESSAATTDPGNHRNTRCGRDEGVWVHTGAEQAIEKRRFHFWTRRFAFVVPLHWLSK